MGRRVYVGGCLATDGVTGDDYRITDGVRCGSCLRDIYCYAYKGVYKTNELNIRQKSVIERRQQHARP